MAATDECAQRACLRIAEVTVMHSVTTNATGLRLQAGWRILMEGRGIDLDLFARHCSDLQGSFV
jgi:hypothetical protein